MNYEKLKEIWNATKQTLVLTLILVGAITFCRIIYEIYLFCF